MVKDRDPFKVMVTSILPGLPKSSNVMVVPFPVVTLTPDCRIWVAEFSLGKFIGAVAPAF